MPASPDIHATDNGAGCRAQPDHGSADHGSTHHRSAHHRSAHHHTAHHHTAHHGSTHHHRAGSLGWPGRAAAGPDVAVGAEHLALVG